MFRVTLQPPKSIVESLKAEPAILLLTLAVYLLVGTLYAVETPEWQVPDEPAHYNYVRQIAEGDLPEIELGDYDQQRLEALLDNDFPPDQSIQWIEYEDHQPPLYYLISSPMYMLSGGSLIAQRVFSLVVGAITILFAYLLLVELFPNRPLILAFALGLVSLIPQHVAMMAGVNNDSLAEVIVVASLYLAMRLIRSESPPSPFVYCLVLTMAFLTKVQSFVVAPVFLAAIITRYLQNSHTRKWLTKWLLYVFGISIMIAALWWARNIATYGGTDLLGLGKHDVVVTGQPTTEYWIRTYGLSSTLERFATFTFQSFWGMFGWMAVPMSPRVYQVLAIASSVILSATALWFLDEVRSKRLFRGENALIWLLLLSLAITSAGYLWWNISYVQHQGRYLYPALVPIAVFVGIGFESLFEMRTAKKVAAVMAILTLVTVVMRSRFMSVSLALSVLVIYALPRVPSRWRRLISYSVTMALGAFAAAALIWFVIPNLG
ncbi:MAG: glycosyltransferase family 39 protein [Chloroflexota bacterium]